MSPVVGENWHGSLPAYGHASPPPHGRHSLTTRPSASSRSPPRPICSAGFAAHRPLVLILDDLQWAEPTALLLVRHLARALANAPILLVSSCRDPGEAVSDELHQSLALLERGEVRRVQLSGMEDDELASLAGDVVPAGSGAERQHVVARLREETAGNPLYASQLIAHWAETGSTGSGDSADDVPAQSARGRVDQGAHARDRGTAGTRRCVGARRGGPRRCPA